MNIKKSVLTLAAAGTFVLGSGTTLAASNLWGGSNNLQHTREVISKLANAVVDTKQQLKTSNDQNSQLQSKLDEANKKLGDVNVQQQNNKQQLSNAEADAKSTASYADEALNSTGVK